MFKVNFLLKGERVARNKTQVQMAEHLGMCKSAYTMKERGQRDFTQKEMESIGMLFRLTPMEFIEIFFPQLFTQMEQKDSLKKEGA